MNNEGEKLQSLIESDEAKKLIQLIKQMDKDNIKPSRLSHEDVETLSLEDTNDYLGAENDSLNFSLEDCFNIKDVYERNSSSPKISVNNIIEKILKYTKIDCPARLTSKKNYVYREIESYRDLIATIIYRSSLDLVHDLQASKSINDKSIKQNGGSIKINNNTIAGLVIYLLFLAKSERFYKYHLLYKSNTNKDESLKEHEIVVYERFYERLASYINLKNMFYGDGLNALDAYRSILGMVDTLEKEKKRGNISFADGKKIDELIALLTAKNKENAMLVDGVLHFRGNIYELKHMSVEHFKEKKLELLCKSLVRPALQTIDEYEAFAVCEEKELLFEQLKGISSNPGLYNYIDKSNQIQRTYLFNKLESFRMMIDEAIASSKL